MKENRAQRDLKSSLPDPSSTDLRGRQSVRATFKLTQECIDMLQIVSTHLRIKQKSLFDHLMEDTEFLSAIGKMTRDRRPTRKNRIQKTFVVSRKTLYSLDKISSDLNASRNALIEHSVRRLLPIISEERKKHEQHKKLMVTIEKHYREGVELLQAIETSLEPEDPIVEKFNSVLATYASMVHHMRDVVEKGGAIEAFQEDILR